MENSTLGKMILLRSEEGYSGENFTNHYWLDPLATEGVPRAYKDYSRVIQYFKDLFGKVAPKNEKILDIGAGAGACVNALLQAGFKAHGCEFSPAGREIAKDLFHIDLDPCDLRERLPYRTNSFGWGLCVGVLSMIPEKYMRNALSEIFRVVKHGVLINVSTQILEYLPENGFDGNPHHITSMAAIDYWRLLLSLEVSDWTGIQPPQKRPYGIGVANEFAGLFSKGAWEF